MTENISLSLFCCTLLLLTVNVLLAVLKKKKIILVFGLFTLLSSVLPVVYIYVQNGHLPMSGTFEKMQNMVMIIILLGLIYEFINRKRDINALEFWIIVVIFQSLAFFDELKADPMFYMYDNVFVAMFFQLRLISIAVLTFSVSMYLTSLRLKTGSDEKSFMMHHAANFTLLGAILFIAGEFSGSMWAQLAYGDSWRWSKNFFTSGAMFLLALLGSHLAPSWIKNKNLQILFSIIPLLIIIILFLT
jgi:ABC-type transport system involved in cytochrome c biogenesis permease subunit